VLLDINTPPDVNAPFGFPQNPLPTTKEASSSSFAPIPPFEEETRGKNRLLVLLFVLVKFPGCKSRALLFSAVAIVASILSAFSEGVSFNFKSFPPLVVL
tara:strand:+ start:598 stop:897 length:300 start_codon:yes stop_codon:yes gene_type:complete